MREPSPTPTERPAILSVIDPRRHAVIEASAGTGKTFTLEHLVIELLRRGARIEEVLVVTFTEKATREMRARVRARLVERVAAGEHALRPALADFERAPISTIHAFCQRALTEHAFASGRLFEEARLDGREAFGIAFKQALRRGLARRAPHRELWLAALEALSVDALEDALYAWARERGERVPGWDEAEVASAIAALPTDDELAGEVGAEIDACVDHWVVRQQVKTRLTSLSELVRAVRASKRVGPHLGALFAWAAEGERNDDRNLAYVARALARHDRLGAPLALLAERAATPLPMLVHAILPQIERQLAEDKAQKGQLDFDDMLLLLRRALEGEHGAELRARLRARYRHALVDEFQDTDETQWAIFRAVFLEAPRPTRESERPHTLYVIGDPKQAIYAFRGADVHAYARACDEIVAAGGVRAHLDASHRSTEALLDGIHAILREGFFTGPNRYDHPVRAARPELVALLPGGAPATPIVLLHAVGKEPLRSRPLRDALADAIAKEIVHLLSGGLRVTDRERGGLRALSASDIHVLTRSGAEGHEIGDALRRRGVPFAFFKQDGLFATAEAADVRDVLAALARPDDRALRLAALMTPFFAVPVEELPRVVELPLDHPLGERLSRLTRLAADNELASLFHALVSETGLARRELYLHASERRLTNYLHLFEVLLGMAHEGRLHITELALRLSALVRGKAKPSEDESVQRLPSERAAVQVLTMHKSKGLEAEVVFLFGGLGKARGSPLAPRVLHRDHARVAWIGPPTEEVKEAIQRETREEDERLLYVAMTRARSRLYLPYVGMPHEGAVRPDAHYEFAHLKGCYAVLDARLAALSASGAVDEPDVRRDDARFERREILVSARRARGSSVAAMPESTTDAPHDAPARAIPAAAYERLRKVSAGFEVTSYSRMKQGRAAASAAIDDASEREELIREAPEGDVAQGDSLPGGTGVGVFLHEAIENLDWALARTWETPTQLLEHAPSLAILTEAAARNDVDARHLPRAAELVFASLRTPIRTPGLALPEGLASVERRVCELPFLHPIPERAHPPLGRAPERELSIERGLVRGVIDVVAEHEGRLIVVDWKSDRLPAWDARTLAAHVEEGYAVQVRLYALAVARMFALADEATYEQRFGGILYVFLRGLDARARGTTRGVWWSRPSFSELTRWDREMRDEDAPWGHPLPPRRAQLTRQEAR